MPEIPGPPEKLPRPAPAPKPAAPAPPAGSPTPSPPPREPFRMTHGVSRIGGLHVPFTVYQGSQRVPPGEPVYWSFGYRNPHHAHEAIELAGQGKPYPTGGVAVDRSTGQPLVKPRRPWWRRTGHPDE